ncbi:MAG: hypothetical protein ABIP30_16125 [Ferruginibacter sp.]
MKKLKWILITLGIIIFCIFIFNRFSEISNCVLVDTNPTDKYYWMFNKSVIDDLVVESSVGNLKNRKYRSSYTYKNLYRYLIIEDSKFDKIFLTQLKFSTTEINTNTRYIETSEGFETSDSNKDVNIISNLCTDLSNKLTLYFNKQASISKYDLSNKTYFTGTFESFLLKNEKEKTQYFFRYDHPTMSEIIFYKPKDRLYFIIVIPFNNQIDLQKGVENLTLN